MIRQGFNLQIQHHNHSLKHLIGNILVLLDVYSDHSFERNSDNCRYYPDSFIFANRVVFSLMIKSTDDDSGNNYRILKVLANRDYLAVDQASHYHILCPQSHSRSSIALHNPRHQKINQENNKSEWKVLEPVQRIAVGTLTYHVYPVKSIEVVWAVQGQNIGPKAVSMDGLIVQAVTHILPYLLRSGMKRAKQCLDLRNAVLVQGELHLLLMNRGKGHPHSLSRSQKKHNLSPGHSSPLEQMVNSELAIIREFGLFLWQLTHQNPFDKRAAKATSRIRYEQLLVAMINQKITYDFLKLKINSLPRHGALQTRHNKHNKVRFLKTNLQSHAQQHMTEPRRRSELGPSNRLLTSPIETESLPRNRAKMTLVEKRRRLRTEIEDENGVGLTNASFRSKRLWGSNRPPSISNQMRSSQSRNAKFEEWLTNTQLSSFRAKLKKQGDSAKQRFTKAISSEADESREGDERFNNLKTRLATRMDRLKTEMRSHSQEAKAHEERHSERRVKIEESRIAKRLFEEQDTKEVEKIGPIVSKVQPVQLQQGEQYVVQIDARKQTQKNEKTAVLQAEESSQEKKEPSQEQIKPKEYLELPIVQQILQSNEETPPLELIQKSIIRIEEPNSPESAESPPHQQIIYREMVENADKSEEPLNQKVQEPPKKMDTVQFKPIPKSFQEALITASKTVTPVPAAPSNPIKITKVTLQGSSSFPSSSNPDQIQQIKLQKRMPHPQTRPLKSPSAQSANNFTAPQIFKKKPEILPSVKYDGVEQSVEEYLRLINVLGSVCLGVIRAQDKLGELQWRKPVYFIYERFLYERASFVEAVGIRAKPALRRTRKVKEEELEEWLRSQEAEMLVAQMQGENHKIGAQFKGFARRTVEQCHFQKKVDYFIRHREKVGASKSRQLRPQLTKIGAGSLIQIYDRVIKERINSKPIFDFILDCLLGLRVMAEMDGLLSEKYWADPQERGKYNYDLNRTNEIVEVLYKLYFPEEGK